MTRAVGRWVDSNSIPAETERGGEGGGGGGACAQLSTRVKVISINDNAFSLQKIAQGTMGKGGDAKNTMRACLKRI